MTDEELESKGGNVHSSVLPEQQLFVRYNRNLAGGQRFIEADRDETLYHTIDLVHPGNGFMRILRTSPVKNQNRTRVHVRAKVSSGTYLLVQLKNKKQTILHFSTYVE